MPKHSTVFFLAVTMAMAAGASARGEGLKQTGAIAIPGTPINSFAIMFIDQTSGLGYLADKDNKSVVVFDTKTDSYVSRVEGMVGLAKNGNASGPNGVITVPHDGAAAELWVSDGDSTIKVADLKTGKITDTISTGGTQRTNGMAFDPKNKLVIVANSNDAPPFLNLISTQPGHKIVAKLPIADSAENIERSAYHAHDGMFYTVLPVLRSAPDGGGLVQTDPKSGTIVKIHPLPGCHPHSLSIVSETTIFFGCSSAHGPDGKPGGDLAVFDIPTGKITGIGKGLGGNGGSALNAKRGLYYHSGGGDLKVIDIKTAKLVEQVKTSRNARSLDVSLANNKVYVATTAKDGPCGGCIQVYAAE
jgi:DNA-binding beta-propeller fold protein YncE